MLLAECVIGGRLRRLKVWRLNVLTVKAWIHYSPRTGHKGWMKPIDIKNARVKILEV